MSQDHHDLFQRSSVFDQLNFFQSLLDSRDLSADQALALLNAIRPELETPQVNKSIAYRRYGQIMESLHREMPEVYDQIVNAWKTKRGIVEVEETPHARLVRERLRTVSSQEGDDTFWDEDQHASQKPASETHAVAHPGETKMESSVEIGEGAEETEEHGEPEEAEEESEQEKEPQEENEKEGEELEEREDEIGDENEPAEKEEEQEEEPEKKEEETEDEEQEEKEPEEELEKEEPETEKDESEEVSGEHESEREEEIAAETEGSESEAEAQEESDHMISEAAEAAAESEHVSMEIEPEEIEPEGEEEPPMEAGE